MRYTSAEQQLLRELKNGCTLNVLRHVCDKSGMRLRIVRQSTVDSLVAKGRLRRELGGWRLLAQVGT